MQLKSTGQGVCADVELSISWEVVEVFGAVLMAAHPTKSDVEGEE